MKRIKWMIPALLCVLVSVKANAQQKIGFVDINFVVDTLYYADSTRYNLQFVQQNQSAQLDKIASEAKGKEGDLTKFYDDSVANAKELVKQQDELKAINAKIDAANNETDKKKKQEAAKMLPTYYSSKDAIREKITKLEKDQADNSIKMGAVREDYIKLVNTYQTYSGQIKESDQIIQDAVQKASLDFVSLCISKVAPAKGYTQVLNGSQSNLLFSSTNAHDLTKDVIKVAIADRKKFREMYNQYYSEYMKQLEQQKQYEEYMRGLQQRGGNTGGGGMR